jgi:dTDP-4-amino-4,6-dideoxygalactose transaminase
MNDASGIPSDTPHTPGDPGHAGEEAGSETLALHGGEPVRRDPWPTYDKGHVFVHPEDEEAAIRAVRSHLYFRYDYRPYHETEVGRFEARLCRYFGSRHSLAVSTGTAAITLGLMAAGIGPGDDVACPGFAFPATPSAIMLAGARPVLIDGDQDLHMDPEDLARRRTPRMKAVVVVHMRGFAADMPAIMRFAEPAGIAVIEDAVPALGVRLHGRHCGTWGLVGAFSTQSDKSINTGEGGFVLTDDTALFARMVALSGAYEGRCSRHFEDGTAALPEGFSDLHLPLYNFRMDEIRGALAEAEMERLPRRLAIQQSNYEHVVAGLRDLDAIRIRRPVAPGASLGESLVFFVESGEPGAAAEFASALRAEGVDARNFGAASETNVRCYWHWRFLLGTDDLDEIRALLPVTSRYLERAVDVPLSPALAAADRDDLVRAVRKVAGALRGPRTWRHPGAAGRPQLEPETV